MTGGAPRQGGRGATCAAARPSAVSRDDDWTGWCEFFLRALIEQANANGAKALAILSLYTRLKEWIVDTSRSQYAVRALDWMFKRPIFRSSDFVQSVEIPKPTALRILRVARDTGLLAVVRPGGGRRAGVFAFSELINIAEGRTVFEVSLESETRPSSTTQFDTDT